MILNVGSPISLLSAGITGKCLVLLLVDLFPPPPVSCTCLTHSLLLRYLTKDGYELQTQKLMATADTNRLPQACSVPGPELPISLP